MQVMPLKTQQSIKREAKFRRQLIVIAILVNILGYALVMWALGQSRQNYRERAETSAQNIARRVKQNIADTFKTIEQSMLATKAEIERQQASGGINDTELNVFLKRLHARLPAMGGIRVINTGGIITHDSGKALIPEAFVDDAGYFQFLRNHPMAGLHISKPLQERASGGWILILSQRFNNPDGSFAGVLNGTVSLSHLQQLFSSSEIGSKGMVLLRNEELGITASYPALPESEWEVSSQTILPEWHKFQRSGRPDGVFLTKSPVDNEMRTAAVNKVDHFPMYVIVGLAHDDYFAKWWQAVATAGESLLLFTLMTALLSIFLYHHWLSRMLFVANKCSIRSRPCRLSGFGNRTSPSTSFRFQMTLRRNAEAVPQTSQARRAGMLVSAKMKTNG